MQPIHSRIAPTPSGFLHRGNAFNFVLTWLLVRRSGGRLRLRIDDYDLPRVRKDYVEDIFRLLDWLQIDWDEGPQSPDAHFRAYSSAARTDAYRALLEKLEASGRTYFCTCTRKTRVKTACTCRERNPGRQGASVRLHVPDTEKPGWYDIFLGENSFALADFTLWRADGLPAYQLASVADDAVFGTDFIVRGNDLRESTAAQICLAQTAGIRAFGAIRFAHHPLIADKNGEKLSKSAGSASMRAGEHDPRQREAFFYDFCRWCGWEAEAGSAQELLQLPAHLWPDFKHRAG